MLQSRSIAFVFLALAGTAHGGVVSFEGTSFPEKGGWTRDVFCNPDRWLEDGWLFQHVALCDGFPPPGGKLDRYERSLQIFASEDKFFFEWRMQTDGDRTEIIGVAPASFTTANLLGVSYHFTIARNQVRFIRDLSLPIIWADIQPGVPHVYRLELYGDEFYIWYIDGQAMDSGVPEGRYPTSDAILSWRAKSLNLKSTTKWDYIRYGTIPVDASGDYDSDGEVDGVDFYFFQECFSASDVDAGPGCRFADFDADTDVDCDDWTAFTLAWTAPEAPPDFPPCAAPTPSIPTASNWATALLTLILLTAGATALSRRIPCRSRLTT